jgi:hypothetical protein
MEIRENENLDLEFFEPDHSPTPQCKCCCDKEAEVTFQPCEDVKDVVVEDVDLQCESRLLKVKVKLDRVCRGRNVAVGVIVCEDVKGVLKTRGFRSCEFNVPGSPGGCVENVPVNDFCFVFPESNLCNQRKFKIKVVAHYTSFPSSDVCPC